MGKKILYGFLSLLLIAVAIGITGFLFKSKPEPKKDDTKHNVRYVQTQSADIVQIESDMSYRGRVTSYDNIALAAEVSGKILQGDVRFKAGESFRKGDVLINIYSEDVEASLKSGKSGLLQSLSQILPDIKVDYPNEYEKWNDFFNSVDPEKALPELPEINSTKEKVFLASNNVLSTYYNLVQQEINLTRYTICAPFNGSFKSVNKEIGAVSSPGGELATIIRSDKLEIVVPVFPEDLQWIKEGDKVKIAGRNGLEHNSTVSRISGFVDESMQSVNVYLTYFAGANDGFLEGSYVDAVFSGSKVNGFQIPREALIDNQYVYALNNTKLEKAEVEIERRLNDAVIISGIDASKLIVVESLTSVDAGVEYMAR